MFWSCMHPYLLTSRKFANTIFHKTLGIFHQCYKFVAFGDTYELIRF